MGGRCGIGLTRTGIPRGALRRSGSNEDGASHRGSAGTRGRTRSLTRRTRRAPIGSAVLGRGHENVEPARKDEAVTAVAGSRRLPCFPCAIISDRIGRSRRPSVLPYWPVPPDQRFPQ